jgi:hypothetical protein
MSPDRVKFGRKTNLEREKSHAEKHKQELGNFNGFCIVCHTLDYHFLHTHPNFSKIAFLTGVKLLPSSELPEFPSSLLGTPSRVVPSSNFEFFLYA